MATNHVLVTLLILLLLPSSLSSPPGRKLISLKGPLNLVKKAYRSPTVGHVPWDELIPSGDESDKKGKSYTITYSYIDIAIEGSYSNAIWDMSGDTIWTNCEPSSQKYIIYDRSKSSTFSLMQCTDPLCLPIWNSTCPQECSTSLTDLYKNSTKISLARDRKFTLGNLELLSDIVFWCGTKNNGVFGNISGIIGLGWETYSLVAQMGHGKFSYCLNSNISDISPLFLVSEQPNLQGEFVQSIPLIQNTRDPDYSSAYYVNLAGISFGHKLLNIPKEIFSLQPNGSRGVILDSGYTYTYLQEEAYKQVKDALVSSIVLEQASGKDVGLDLCFQVSNPNQFPKVSNITLHFGNSVDMELDGDHFMVTNGNGSLLCLAILPSTMQPYYDESVSVLGYLVQADKHMVFDLKNSRLYYKPANCNTSMTQLIQESSSDLRFQVGFGFYFQILIGFLFPIVAVFIF